MDKVIMPFLFVAVAAGLFFSYIRPTYDVLLALQEQEERLDVTLERSKNLDERISSLTQKYNSMSQDNIKKLDSLLPASVDSVRTVVLLDTLAKRSAVDIEEFDLPNYTTSVDESDLKWADFSIQCTGGYDNVKQFLLSMERSLTLMEVTELKIASAKSESARANEPATESTPSFTIGFKTPYLIAVVK